MIESADFHHYLILSLSVVFVLISAMNLSSLTSLASVIPEKDKAIDHSLVSVLIPVRNEESRIGICLESIKNQTYSKLEILVLNDRSQDGTEKVIQASADVDSRVRAITGSTPPEDWVGKNWACHQLFQQSRGEFLLFIDADTILTEDTITAAVHQAELLESDLLTVIPQRMTACAAERLLFPLMDWMLFCWLPIRLAHKKTNRFLSATFGQFMLFRREAYEAVGGHFEIAGEPLDDFSLGRRTKSQGLRWVLFQGTGTVAVAASSSNRETIRSVSRSLFPALNYSLSIFVLLTLVFSAVGFLPLLTLINGALWANQEYHRLVISACSLCLVLTSWYIVCRKFHHSLLLPLFHPLSTFFMLVVGYHSVISYAFQITHWKGRSIPHRRIHW